MTLNPNQFRTAGGVYEDYMQDTTGSWPLSHGGTAGNVEQRMVVEPTGNGRWGGHVRSARYDTDSGGNIRSYDSDDETRVDEIRTPRGRKDFRTLARAAVVGRNMAPLYAQSFAESQPEY